MKETKRRKEELSLEGCAVPGEHLQVWFLRGRIRQARLSSLEGCTVPGEHLHVWFL